MALSCDKQHSFYAIIHLSDFVLSSPNINSSSHWTQLQNCFRLQLKQVWAPGDERKWFWSIAHLPKEHFHTGSARLYFSAPPLCDAERDNNTVWAVVLSRCRWHAALCLIFIKPRWCSIFALPAPGRDWYLDKGKPTEASFGQDGGGAIV